MGRPKKNGEPAVPAVQGAGAALPAYYQGDTGADQIDPNDTIIPRLKICQGQSNIKSTATIKDGEFYNHLTGEVYGPAVEFYVVGYQKSRIWFKDFKLICIEYVDQKTKQRVRSGDENVCLDYDSGKDSFNYMVVLKKDLAGAIKANTIPNMMIFSCMSAAGRAARQLNGKLLFNAQRKIPIFAQEIICSTNLEKFKTGSAHMPMFRYRDTQLDEVSFKMLHGLFKVSTDIGMKKIHAEDEAENDGPETPL
jgi:hypothetical protein